MIRTSILNDLNDTITNLLSNQISWDTVRTTPFQFPNCLLETTYVNTCNLTITNTRPMPILLRLHDVSSRLLLKLWHSNCPEPKVHFFVLESKSHLSPNTCPWWSPISSTHHITPKVRCAQSLAQCFCNKKAVSLWAPPTMSCDVCVTLLFNHQQICVLTCAQPTWSLMFFLQILLITAQDG